jgi:hypothetical protein
MKPLAAMAVVLVLDSSAAAAEGPARLSCSQKTFPNIQGQNAVTLARQANGTYTANYEAYGAPKTKKGLKCSFDADPKVFHCMTANASWGIFGKRLDEKSIDGDGKVKDEHVYEIEAVKTPVGEPRTEQKYRFAIEPMTIRSPPGVACQWMSTSIWYSAPEGPMTMSQPWLPSFVDSSACGRRRY